MLKIRRSWDRLIFNHDRLIFNTGIPILVRRHLCIETAPVLAKFRSRENGFRTDWSLWKLSDLSSAILPRHLAHLRTIRSFQQPNLAGSNLSEIWRLTGWWIGSLITSAWFTAIFWALYYYCDMLSKDFKPMGVQFSFKALLSLAEMIATAPDRCIITGPWALAKAW